MEAWFISHPDILDKFYQTDLTKKISRSTSAELENFNTIPELFSKSEDNREFLRTLLLNTAGAIFFVFLSLALSGF